MPPFKTKILEEHVKEMAKHNPIRPSFSSWSAPLVLIPKRTSDGTKADFNNTEGLDPSKVFQNYRVCIDFRKLNAITKKDSYALPRIDDTLDALGYDNNTGPTLF